MADDVLIFGASGSRKICEYLDVQPGAGGKETV